MKRLLVLLLLLAGCRSAPVEPAPEPTPAPPEEPTPLVQYDDQGRRISRGFLKNVPRRVEPLSDEEQAKQAKIEAEERAARAVPLTPEQRARRIQVAGEDVWAFDLYREGALVRRIPAAGWETPVPLGDVVLPAERAGMQSLLAHGSSGSRWIGIEDIASLQLRVNRQGRLKLEAVGRRGRRLNADRGAGTGQGTGGGGGAGDGKGTGKRKGGKRAFREQEIQGVYWLELSPQAAPTPESEPTPPGDGRSVERME